MTSNSIGSCVRIGLIGLGPAGMHHLERISLRADLKVVAACDAGMGGSGGAARFCDEVDLRVDDLILRKDLDYVLIATPQTVRAELAARTLESGKNVVLELPIGANAKEAQQLLGAARQAGRHLCVLPNRPEGVDFYAARQTVRDMNLGAIYSARLISWGKGVPAGVDDPQAALDLAFGHFAFQYVSQLIRLVGPSPTAVFAKIIRHPAIDPPTEAFSISLDLPSGGDALIDVDLQSEAMLHTGWMLAGSKGSYFRQRVYVGETSGETSDAPVAIADLPHEDIYAELLATARSGDALLESATIAVSVMRVIDAARESARTGRTIRFDEMP